MRRLLQFPFTALLLVASGWLMLGLTVIDQRDRFPYDDGGIGTIYFAGQAIANLILWPGLAITDRLNATASPETRWLSATIISIFGGLLLDMGIQAVRRRRLPAR